MISTRETRAYFDLHLQGIGYLSRLWTVTPKEGAPFLCVTIAALRGRVDNAQYTHFECRVSGPQAQELVRRLQPSMEANRKVLAGFTLSDLCAEPFTVRQGERAGQTAIRLKSRLLRLSWIRVEGQPFYTAADRQEAVV